jgi:hypothetical protein
MNTRTHTQIHAITEPLIHPPRARRHLHSRGWLRHVLPRWQALPWPSPFRRRWYVPTHIHIHTQPFKTSMCESSAPLCRRWYVSTHAYSHSHSYYRFIQYFRWKALVLVAICETCTDLPSHCVCMCVCVYIYIYIHTHIQTNKQTNMHGLPLGHRCLPHICHIHMHTHTSSHIFIHKQAWSASGPSLPPSYLPCRRVA